MSTIDRHKNMKPKSTKTGEYIGYYKQRVMLNSEGEEELVYDDNGNPVPDYTSWVTGQPTPNKPTAEQLTLINNTLNDYHNGPINYWKSFGRDLVGFFKEVPHDIRLAYRYVSSTLGK